MALIDEAQVRKVAERIDKLDPEAEDDELQAMYNALRFTLGYEGDADAFIRMYVSDE